jgi:uncharacterized protein (TIGR02678 family)
MTGTTPLAASSIEPGTASEALLHDERRRALRLLLTRPLLGDAGPDPEGFALVRRHAGWLREWCAEQLGYRLVVETELARLHKRPAPGALPRPARTRSGTPFDARRYALLCLILAALERTGVQTTLSTLAEEVKLLASAEPVRPVELERHTERQGFVDAVRLLVEQGVLQLTDGDDTQFVEGRGDALYDVDGRRLAQLLTIPVPAELLGPDDLATEVYPHTDEGANRRLRHRLMRRLIEEPVLYLADLDEAERAYLATQRHFLVARAVEATGLEAEVRREGVALIDDSGRVSDVAFPSHGTVAHAALLLSERLAERARRAGAGEGDPPAAPPVVPWMELHAAAEELLARFGRYWSKAYRDDPGGPDRLLSDALDRLEELALIIRHPEGVEPRPAIARYRVDESGDESETPEADA